MTPAEELAGLPLVKARDLVRTRIATIGSEWHAAWSARVWTEITTGRSRADVARELGISQPAVSKLLAKAGYPTGTKSGRPKRIDK